MSKPIASCAPTCRENPSFDILYWVGCAASYDSRAQRIARALVALLQHARINFAFLGDEEKCTGDAARRLGDEFLFQELATANIATLRTYNVRRILTHCPHCLNALLKDYPQFGGHYDVVHHSQFLAQLIAEGRLPSPPSVGGRAAVPITYHDPCYLARVNGIQDEPRHILKSALGSRSLCEMKHCRGETSCCGAGGGRMWMEEPAQQRVSTARAREALVTGAQIVATSCPFCLTMIADGVAANGSNAQVLDIAEILAEHLNLLPATQIAASPPEDTSHSLPNP